MKKSRAFSLSQGEGMRIPEHSHAMTHKPRSFLPLILL
jgi:hypothetical protein